MSRPQLLGTKSIPWHSIGTIDATASEADATLGVAERVFQLNKALDNVKYYQVPPAISALHMRFLLTTNNHTADIEVWTGKLPNKLDRDPSADCDLIRRGTLDVVCGQQDAYGTSKHYADTITVTNDGTEDGWGDSDPGADHMRIRSIDLKGDNIVLFHGFDTFDGDCEIEVSGYS